VLNSQGKIVHLGAVGTDTFIPGNKDGARKREITHALPLHTAIAMVKQNEGVSYAAHPGAYMKLLHRVLLNRGNWSCNDIVTDMTAYQIVNGDFSTSYFRARALWIKLLLSGKKIPIIAGNDAHGDFNRYRAIKKPFLSIYENPNRYFGNAKTAIYTPHPNAHKRDGRSIISAIKEGKTFVTDGPFLCISTSPTPADTCISNTPIPKTIHSLFIIGISSCEFGFPCLLRIFRGVCALKKESVFALIPFNNNTTLSFIKEITIDWDRGAGYIRAELICKNGAIPETTALTSPCYLECRS
jgi:hypothetical protein